MKRVLFGLAFIGGLIGGAILLNTGAIPVSELRAARVPCGKIIEKDCPAGVVATKDYCLCITNKEAGELPDEELIVPVGKRKDLVVCEITDPKLGKYLATSYEPAGIILPANCKRVVSNVKLPGVSFHNVPTGIEVELETACAPCTIGPDSWGPCPECFFRGDCDKVCPKPEEIP